MIRFIIPAAGSATRFNGVLKELLPINARNCGLTQAVSLAWNLGGTAPIVITTAEKAALHAKALEQRELTVDLRIKDNPEDGDMWGSVKLGIDPMRNGGIILPDTVVTASRCPCIAPITFGCFATKTPERYSCVELTRPEMPMIVTKGNVLTRGLAWGLVTWDAVTGRALLDSPEKHYDRAFESMMKRFAHGFGLFMLDSFHDLGTFEQYQEYLCENRAAGNEPR